MKTSIEQSLGDVLVLGVGTTGRALVDVLLSDAVTIHSLTLVSEHINEEMSAFAKSKGLEFITAAELDARHFDLAIASPGISVFSSLFCAAEQASLEIIGEPEFAWRLSPERWIAVTGTNGKTTTVTLINQMLRASQIPSVAAGNIGRSLVEVAATRSLDTWIVAELSSYQLATIQQLHPNVACLLNIDEDHLSWHKTHEHYVASKARIFKNMDEHDQCIVGIGDVESAKIADALKECGLHLYSINENEVMHPGYTIALPGLHNVENALAATVAARFAGATEEAIAHVLKTFTGLPHRIEKVDVTSPIDFYNDSKATNIDAALSAILALQDKHPICLFGGVDKGGNLHDFAVKVAGIIDMAICFGAAQERFAAALKEAGVKTLLAPCMRAALEGALVYAQPGQTILFSPACASFDEFSSFEERGNAFKQIVKELV